MVKRKTLADLRNSIKEKGNAGNSVSNFWTPAQLPTNGVARVRFAPYDSKVTGGFWEQLVMFNLSFRDENGEPVTVRFPAKSTFISNAEAKLTNNWCPVTTRLSAVYSEAKQLRETDPERADELWKAALAVSPYRNYLYQGFVYDKHNGEINPMELRPIRITKSIHKLISAPLIDESLAAFDDMPTGQYTLDDVKHYLNNTVPDDMTEEEFEELFVVREFIFRKSTKGNFNDYSTSSWAPKTHVLEPEQLAYIAENGFINLSSFLPPQPTDEQYQFYLEVFEEALAYALGEGDGLFNPEWENPEYGLLIIRPNNNTSEAETTSTSSNKSTKVGSTSRIKKPAKQVVVEEDDEFDDDDTENSNIKNVNMTVSKIKSSIRRRPVPVDDDVSDDDLDDDLDKEDNSDSGFTKQEIHRLSSAKSRVSNIGAKRLRMKTE